jgi:hypothetical protein
MAAGKMTKHLLLAFPTLAAFMLLMTVAQGTNLQQRKLAQAVQLQCLITPIDTISVEYEWTTNGTLYPGSVSSIPQQLFMH